VAHLADIDTDPRQVRDGHTASLLLNPFQPEDGPAGISHSAISHAPPCPGIQGYPLDKINLRER
jgi:hypothetical protein